MNEQRGAPPQADPGVHYAELAATWDGYAAFNRTEAEKRKQANDWFGAELALARAEVRQQAAEILRQFAHSPEYAAKVMYANAVDRSVSRLPVAEASAIDEATRNHTRARAWQDCAHAIDPSLPEVQPRWD